MSKPPCDYCGNPAHYMFGDGEVVCSACNIRLPHSSRGARKRIAELERENAALQARIDELMWEHCPDEMTQEQIDNFAKHQRPVDAETERAIDAAISKIKEVS